MFWLACIPQIVMKLAYLSDPVMRLVYIFVNKAKQALPDPEVKLAYLSDSERQLVLLLVLVLKLAYLSDPKKNGVFT